MTEAGKVYAEALYGLAKEEGLTDVILGQLKTLDSCFAQEPDFLQLLDAPNLSKAERCRILDDCFCGKVEAYVLNFLKILTEKGRMRHFSHCVKCYCSLYNRDNDILPVTAVTSAAMTDAQKERLTQKLQKITGRRIELVSRLDPTILGGMRLDYDGKRVDGTVIHRLDAVRNMLRSTAL